MDGTLTIGVNLFDQGLQLFLLKTLAQCSQDGRDHVCMDAATLLSVEHVESLAQHLHLLLC